MPRLPALAWRPLFDAVFEMNSAATHADFVTAVSSGLHRLVRADTCTFQLLDRERARLRLKMIPDDAFNAAEIAYYTTHAKDMPLVAHWDRTGDTRAVRISDVIGPRAWRRHPHYLNTIKRQGLVHVLALPINVTPTVVAAIAFNRRRPDFTLHDRALLDAFAPHFLLAYARQKDPWRIDDHPVPPDPAETLTARERDVLYWVTEGKQNREIATILGRSLATVQEHVANILRKLHVENRHALTVYALRNRASRR